MNRLLTHPAWSGAWVWCSVLCALTPSTHSTLTLLTIFPTLLTPDLSLCHSSGWLFFFFYMKPLRSSSLHNFFGHQIPSLVLFHRLEWSIIPISCFSSRKLKVYFVKSIIRYFYSTRDCSRTSEVTLKSKNFFKRILENKYWKVKYIVYNGDSPSSSTSYASEGS